jgi:uncharacterized protein YhaN
VRLRRLDLLRYGRFTDRSIELPAGQPDLHILFGPNEAGKSTALAAIEDLLFGIPPQTPFAFLHDYREMRVGASLEGDGGPLEIVRRKGSKDTLLGPDELPLDGGEGRLRAFLGGADRAFFERMFSLDHQRLEAGGREILDARDEIGQVLFSAGAGIEGLHARLTALEAEADALWGPRKASRRLYTQGEERLERSERDLRECTLTAAEWQRRGDAYTRAERDCTELEQELEQAQAESRQLARIRRVYRQVGRKAELESRMAALGPVPELPDDAGALFEAALRKDIEAAARIETLEARLRKAREELDEPETGAALLARAEEIALLHERRIEIRRGRNDLPRREAELETAQAALRALAMELGWQGDDVGALIRGLPPRPRLSLVRSLLGQRGEVASALSARAAAVRDSETETARLGQQLQALPPAVDASQLSAATAAARGLGDIDGRLREAEVLEQEALARRQRLLAELQPPVADLGKLAGMQVPARAEVQDCRDRLRDWDVQARSTAEQVRVAKAALLRDQAALERAARDEGVIEASQVQQARVYRDGLWNLVRRRYVERQLLAQDEEARFAGELRSLAAAFESATAEADRVADQRFGQAETLGRLGAQARSLEERRQALAELLEEREALAAAGERLRAHWNALWGGASFDPLGPDAMLEWLDTRSALLEAAAQHHAASARLQAQRDQERSVRHPVLGALAGFGLAADALCEEPLPMLLERAGEHLRACENAALEAARLRQVLHEAQTDLARKHLEHERAQAQWSEWQDRWSRALADLGLAPDSDPEEVARQVELIDEMRDLAQRITALQRDRIDKIRADLSDFERTVAATLEESAADLRDRPPDEAVAELEQRLARAQEERRLRQERRARAGELEQEIVLHESGRREAAQAIASLRRAAGCADDAALREAIGRSSALAALKAELGQVLQVLEQEGDGLPVAELDRECAGADLDRNTAREETLAHRMEDLRGRQAAAIEARSQARDAFQAIGGDDAAAQAAAQRQEALAAMRDAAEGYVRARSSALLLRWAIDRYRRERQAPLLRRAGELFATLTRGSFQALAVEYDAQDRPRLTGLRADGKAVPVPGLSTGTADQLYLALRLASIEDYLERAPGLPFVADDLFVHFDDERSAAGFEVLGQLAGKTQVLFFTHHRHLVDLARAQLGASTQVAFLAEE